MSVHYACLRAKRATARGMAAGGLALVAVGDRNASINNRGKVSELALLVHACQFSTVLAVNLLC